MKILKLGQWVLAISLAVIGSIGHASMSYPNGSVDVGASALADFLDMDTRESVQVRRNGSGVNSYGRLKEMGSPPSNFGNLSKTATLVAISRTFQPGFDPNGHLVTSFGEAQSLTIIGAATSQHTEAGSTSAAFGLLPQWDGAYDSLKRRGAWSSFWLSALYSSIFNNLANAPGHPTINGTLNFSFGSFVFSITPISTVSSVPLPGAVWLFGSCLFGMMVWRRKTGLFTV